MWFPPTFGLRHPGIWRRGRCGATISASTVNTRTNLASTSMSKFLKKLRPAASGAGIESGSRTTQCYPLFRISRFPPAKKQRLIDGTKMLLDIAKESADAFPPLKSCLGGISALIKHHEVRLRRSPHDLSDESILGKQRRRREA